MHDDDDDHDWILPPVGEPEFFGFPDFQYDEHAPTDIRPPKPAATIHRVKPQILRSELGMKQLYVRAASTLDSSAPDVTTKLGQVLCQLAVCAFSHCRAWPLVGEDGDEEVLLAVRRVVPGYLKKNATRILECTADEIHAASCAIEALIVLDLLRHDLPAGINN